MAEAPQGQPVRPGLSPTSFKVPLNPTWFQEQAMQSPSAHVVFLLISANLRLHFPQGTAGFSKGKKLNAY